MHNMTLAQLVSILAKVLGGALLIVILSFPIQSLSNYFTGEVRHKQQEAQFDKAVNNVSESVLPRFVQKLIPHSDPARGLVPPPPPMPFAF